MRAPATSSIALALPHAFLAATLALAWLAPGMPFAADAGEARSIVLMESALLFASILVGGFLPLSYTALPLVLLGVVGWLLLAGRAGFSLSLLGFAWGVVAAFREGVRAWRGELGLARENIDHPHRRYDRVVLVWLACLPLAPVLWLVADQPWHAWGAIYFTLLVLADTVLKGAIDRIPRALLRRMQANVDPEISARLGICGTCRHVSPAIPASEGRYVRCLLSTKDARFPEYPLTPLATCPGHVPREP